MLPVSLLVSGASSSGVHFSVTSQVPVSPVLSMTERPRVLASTWARFAVVSAAPRSFDIPAFAFHTTGDVGELEIGDLPGRRDHSLERGIQSSHAYAGDDGFLHVTKLTLHYGDDIPRSLFQIPLLGEL